MKRKLLFNALFILSISLSACAQNNVSSNSSPSVTPSVAPSSIISEPSSIALSSASSAKESSSEKLSSTSTFPSYSYDFPKKEDGLTLEQITEEIDKIDPKPQEQRKVRYSWHFVEKITGLYPNSMLDGKEMPEGEITADIVSETRKHNLDADLVIVSGTPVTQMQQLYARDYTSSVTPSGWLSYHAQRRRFLESAQEGEGFDERFYTGPLTLWMISWGRRPANAQMDGIYFAYDELERVYGDDGYCTWCKFKEYRYLKGTLSSWNNGSKEFNGSYELTATCSIEYLD